MIGKVIKVCVFIVGNIIVEVWRWKFNKKKKVKGSLSSVNIILWFEIW